MKVYFLLLMVCLLSACGSKSSYIRSNVTLEQYTADIGANLSKPEGEGPYPAIILMHGCNGLGASELKGLKQHADYFAKRGYVTLILDSFGPRRLAGGQVCVSFDKLGSARYYRTFDAFAAYDYLKSQPFVNDSIYLIGQSNGGSVALQSARKEWQETVNTSARFSAVVGYYPWCGVISGLNITLNTPTLVLAGEKDDWTPAEECTVAEKSIQSPLLKVVVYSGAYHSFDLPINLQQYAGHTVGRNGPALIDSRKQILKFFEKNK